MISEKNSKTGDKIKYVYDDNGNLIEKKTKGKSTVYSYDTENRLRSVTKGGQILLAATYDGDGNKVFQMSRKYVDGTKQTSKKKKVKTATIQEADEDSDGDGSDETAETKKAKVPTVKENFDPDIFWYGGTQGVMKLTAGQCPALLAAIGKEIRDLWHGFKTFVTGDYTEINMGQNVGKTAEEKNGDTLTANEMATIVVPGTERATLVTWDITNYLNDTNFNENAQVMYQYDQGGKEKASYVYGETDSRISGELTKEAVKYTEQKAGDYSYLYDGQGNVANTVRNGSVAESYSYDPFGEMTAEGKEGAAKTPLEAKNDNGLSDNDVLWGYNGEEYIEEVGLQYLRQRHYSPETGTFTSQDTNEGDLTNPLSQNRYIYAENDPVNGNDPGGDKKKAKKASTKKTNKKTTKSSSKSSKKTSKKTNKKTTSKKSPSKKKAASKKKTTLKWNGKKAWKNLKSYMKGRWKSTKKNYRALKDKATALKNSVKCGSAKVMRKITGIDRKISKALTPKKKDGVVKKYLKGAGSNLYGQYKGLARSFISGNGDLTLGILKETSKSLGSSLLHPKRSLKGLLNYYPDMVKKNGLAYTAGNISVDVAEMVIAKKISSGAVKKITKGSLKGDLKGLTVDEKKVIDNLIEQGKNVEIIPRSKKVNEKTPDFFVNGEKTELKTLNGSSLNTPVKRIREGFSQGATTVIIDARKTTITLKDAKIIVDRAEGSLKGTLPGKVEIWTNEGIYRR